MRYYDNQTVLVNYYGANGVPVFHQKLKKILHSERLQMVEVPYNPYGNVSRNSAKGIYINYLQMENFILLPTFDLPEDEPALRVFEKLFPGTTIAAINTDQIAKDSGILNCITWNIKL